MTSADEKTYKESRPYIRAAIALFIYLRWGGNIEASFNKADEFLTSFEQRRSV